MIAGQQGARLVTGVETEQDRRWAPEHREPTQAEPRPSARNWRNDNSDWESACIVTNSVVSNRQARVATKAYLKQKLGLELNEVEQATLGTPVPTV